METLTLVSHHLCPYVQRAAIALAEKGVAYERVYVDLADKPDWFKALSPLGKTPVLKVGETAIFESAVILEYLEETRPNPLHPADALRRSEHRSLIEFGSAILNDIWAFYSAPDAATFAAKRKQLSDRFAWLERRLVGAPWFDGTDFSLVDAVFAPVFRYFDAFDRIGRFAVLDGLPKLARWRQALAARPSVIAAVTEDYHDRLWRFLLARNSHLTGEMQKSAA
ncbi:glutathione S-transferase family protein [Dongia sedimenti]|uniref:glutathione transferase n=1 Tax=Dongia sedimenti TaxID=3064282 RepID=A0ABU0YV60_9PROT|nr:glutathione S-transferase family protein [Rhodospirillaceae bacterium R-7]